MSSCAQAVNVPLAAAFFAAWVGIPMWLVFKHPDRGPGQPVTQAAQDHQIRSAKPQKVVAALPSRQLTDVA